MRNAAITAAQIAIVAGGTVVMTVSSVAYIPLKTTVKALEVGIAATCLLATEAFWALEEKKTRTARRFI